MVGFKKRGRRRRRRRTFFFYPFSSFSTQFPRLRSAFGLASLGIICSNLKLLVHPRYVEASQTLKHFIFLEIFWFVCFPSIYAISSQKKRFLAKNKAKMVGNRQNQKNFRKTDKVKTFV